MPRVKGKEQLCLSEKKYFTSVQGIGGSTLFDRYQDIEGVIEKNVDEKFRHFLAQPVVEEDLVYWFSVPYNETPRRYKELTGDEKERYKVLKAETLEYYGGLISLLEAEGKGREAEWLSLATRYVNEEFLYCYDGRLILGIWGMQLRDTVREPLGIAMRNQYRAKSHQTEVLEEKEVPKVEEELQVMEAIPELDPFQVRFISGEGGILEGAPLLYKQANESVRIEEVPEVRTNPGFEFMGWDKNPVGYNIAGDTAFTARYRQVLADDTTLPWHRRFRNWLGGIFTGGGCLRWLLWLLLLLLLLLLFCWLFRECSNSAVAPIPYPIEEKPWVSDDPNVGDDGGIYDPGNPYEPIPSPPGYEDILPPEQGVLPPFDTTNIIRRPGSPSIVGNRLNILMENEEKSIIDFISAFKVKYPSDKYKVVYYDDVVKRMQIEFPEQEREKLKIEIPINFSPEYQLFIFDEALFEGNYIPNDPAFSDANKAWYLNAINAPRAWDITKGGNGTRKLTIAIVDNGFSLKHPELKSKVVMPYNVWAHSKNVYSQVIDHGTHVAGIAIGVANNGKGLLGIAPDCYFMPVQVANKENMMTTTSVLDGILYALYQGADVINVSLGMQFSGELSNQEQQNLQNNHFKEEERLWNEVMKISEKHKAIVVLAAGNNNMLAGVSPMNRPKNFIVVSATDKDNRGFRKAGFSNYGDYSTISAPGVNIFSSIGNDGYQMMDGTSMAAPIITGSVALMKSLNADLTAEQIICILQSTGKQTEGNIGSLIQLDKALEKVKSGRLTQCNTRPETPSTGDVQILLSWNNYNDLDLVCIDPNNESVWFNNKKVSSGGFLEIDMNRVYPDSESPVENIFWPTGGAPQGTYHVYLVYYRKHVEINKNPYIIKVKYGDKTEEFSGEINIENTSIPICSFTLGSESNGGNTVNPDFPNAGRNREKLMEERNRLRRQLEEIEAELEGIQND